MDRILAIDAGTTGVRALVVDEAGGVTARGHREFPQSFPRPGWVEHDPEDWWTAALQATREALSSAEIEARDLTALAITNQRETTVVWDRRTLQAVHPAIVWQDRRTAPLCERLREEGWETPIRERTGLVIDPYFSATKLAWLLEEVEGVRDEAGASRLAFGTVDAYLVARLTGGRVHATDHSNAARTMLFDIHRLAWDEDLLTRFDIPRELLPEVRNSSGDFGATDPEAFFGASIPVGGVAGDQQAALVGQACFGPGDAKNTYGTGSFLLLNTGEKPATGGSGLLTTIAYSDAEGVRYALEGSIFVTGAAIQWLRDGLGVIARSDEAGPLAASVPDTGGVYFVPALTGLGAPWWDPYARGLIGGITRGTGRAHLVRAAVEAMAYQTRDVADAMVEAAGTSMSELKADGGASAMDVLMQFQADLLGVPVRRPVHQETTGLGAAYLAGLSAGVWSSKEEVAASWQLDREFIPGDTVEADRRYGGWRRAVERTLGWERRG
ncbi:MAG TPA: glycerol kinase GlpK [Actinomycetota bacterium]|nr:glycerol kinase GlpK [Actinomycetota bacterium]